MSSPARRKANIPHQVKEEVWRLYGGSLCWCCQREPVTVKNKHFGHIVAEAEGGEVSVDNLRPICANCNLRMGTKNMYEFMREEGFPVRDVAVLQAIVDAVARSDPGLFNRLAGREIFLLPCEPSVTTAYPPGLLSERPDGVLNGLRLVLRERLLKEAPFLDGVKLNRLFTATKLGEVRFWFVTDPDFIAWIRWSSAAGRMGKIARRLRA